MSTGSLVKRVLKPLIPAPVLRMRRHIWVVCSLYRRFGPVDDVPKKKDLERMASIRRTYKKIMVLQMPWRNIGGMGLMYQWLCEHREPDTLYLFYREYFAHSRKCPNTFLETLICRDLIDMEENPLFWLRVLKSCFWKVDLLDFSVSYRDGICISREFYGGEREYRYDGDGRRTGYFSFTDEDVHAGDVILDRLKVEKGHYVCIFARDAAYYNQFYDKQFTEDAKWSNELMERYRDADIDSFQAAAAYLSSCGLSCVRMGEIVSRRDKFAHIADYTNEQRSAFGDVYVFAHAKFFLGDPSGIFVFPLLAKKPMAFTNVSSFFSAGDSQTEGTLMIYKKFYRPADGTYLTLREILELHIHLMQEHRGNHLILCFWDWLSDHEYVAISNSETEIQELAEEMLQILDHSVHYTEEEIELKRRYKDIMHEYIVKDEFLSVCAEIGAKWIVKNAWFLEA